MKRLVIYVHGKGGSAEEALHYESLFADSDVVGFDYKAQSPWEAGGEFRAFYDEQAKGYDSVILIANSIGAYFSMSSLSEVEFEKALLISPIVDMEKLITDMLTWVNVSEKELEERLEISTDFGETLSWEYLCYVREHPLNWKADTYILYGEKDNLTSIETMSSFANRISASLTVMKDGEHWFHTEEQMSFLDNWITELLS